MLYNTVGRQIPPGVFEKLSRFMNVSLRKSDFFEKLSRFMNVSLRKSDSSCLSFCLGSEPVKRPKKAERWDFTQESNKAGDPDVPPYLLYFTSGS